MAHICHRPAAALLCVIFPPGVSVMERPLTGTLPVPTAEDKQDVVNYGLALKALAYVSLAEVNHVATSDVRGK